MRWVSKLVLVTLLVLSLNIHSLTKGVPEALADVFTFYLDNTATENLLTAGNEWELLEGTTGGDSLSTTVTVVRGDVNGYRQFLPGTDNSVNADHGACANGTADGYGWLFPDPFIDGAGSIDAGDWTIEMYESDSYGSFNGDLSVCIYTVTISGGSISGSTLLFQYTDSSDSWDGAASSHVYTTSQSSFSPADDTYLYAEFFVNMTSTLGKPGTYSMSFGTGTTYGDPYIQPPNMTIPEKVVYFLAAVPFIPLMVLWFKKIKK